VHAAGCISVQFQVPQNRFSVEAGGMQHNPSLEPCLGDGFRHRFERIIRNRQKEVIAKTWKLVIPDRTDVMANKIGGHSRPIRRPARHGNNRLTFFCQQAAESLADSTRPRNSDAVLLHSLACHYTALSALSGPA